MSHTEMASARSVKEFDFTNRQKMTRNTGSESTSIECCLSISSDLATCMVVLNTRRDRPWQTWSRRNFENFGNNEALCRTVRPCLIQAEQGRILDHCHQLEVPCTSSSLAGSARHGRRDCSRAVRP